MKETSLIITYLEAVAMNYFKEYIKANYTLEERFNDRDKILIDVAYLHKETHYLTFTAFYSFFKSNFGLKGDEHRDFSKYLYVFFCFGNRKQGLGIIDVNLRYTKFFANFLNNTELKGYINTPTLHQNINYNDFFNDFKTGGINAIDTKLFNSYLTKDKKLKIIENLGTEIKTNSHFGNKIDLYSYILDLMITQIDNGYKLFFTTPLDIAGLSKRYSTEQVVMLGKITKIIYVENNKTLVFQEHIDNYDKENYIKKQILNNL